ncbi:MAG: iron complex outermembrane receptor protein [Chitinophagales bacterium]|jgi:iron complex outermembrane receptor protein
MIFSFKKIAVAVALATVAAPSVSFSQETSGSSSFLEEIVVTASKRAATLQETPIAVTVTSGATIDKAAIQDVIGLQSVVPTLRVTQLQSSTNTTFSIRGFGNGANNEGIEPSVGVFIDGVYRSRAGAAISDLPRLERVEVLSGPQSTLFGKNASAGVISVITPKPSGETGGYIAGSLGNIGYTNFKGLFESSISEDLTFDVSANYTQRDGYFENIAGGDAVNERNRWGIRGQMVWTPTDSTEVRIIADYDELDEACCGTVNVVNGPTSGIVNALGGRLVPEQPFGFQTSTDIDPFNEVENGGISMQVDVDYDTVSLTSITALRSSDTFEALDIDFTSAALTQTSPNSVAIDTFTQEVRLTSTSDSDVEWMVGAFYFNESLDYTSDVLWGSQARNYFDGLVAGLGAPGALGGIEGAFGFPAGTFFANGTGAQDTFSQDDEAISFFGQADWHINDRLTATAGLNYTKVDKAVTFNQVNTNIFAAIPAGFLGGLAALQASLPPTVGFPNQFESGKSEDDDTTYTLRFAYDLSDSINLYASTASGFKSSSWNLSRDTAPNASDLALLSAAGLTANAPNQVAGGRFAEPESSLVYEIGLKARFERGSLNLAIFDQTIENFQSSIFNGTGFQLLNAGEQSTQGIEFDLNYYPIDSLKLGLAGIFLDPIYDSFPLGGSGPPIGLTGLVPAGIPDVSLSLSATYDFRIGNSDAFVRADYQYEDEVQVVDNISIDLISREVSSLNASAGINTENGYSFTVWARNLTDDQYLLSGFPTPAQAGSLNSYPNEPRTFGVTVRKDF